MARQDESVKAKFNEEQKPKKIPGPHMKPPPEEEANSLVRSVIV